MIDTLLFFNHIFKMMLKIRFYHKYCIYQARNMSHLYENMSTLHVESSI